MLTESDDVVKGAETKVGTEGAFEKAVSHGAGIQLLSLED